MAVLLICVIQVPVMDAFGLLVVPLDVALGVVLVLARVAGD